MNSNEPCCIASIDKDFYQVGGLHYNFVKKEFKFVSELEGQRFLYLQSILGDKADNIPGYDGKMRTKIPQFLYTYIEQLNSFTEEEDMHNFVWEMHQDHHTKEQFETYLKCLWLWREEGDIWQNKFGQGPA